MGLRFSANLGFLWTELALPDAVRAAHAAGFDAVELHWPYATPAPELRAALAETGLRCLGLNTSKGDGNGLSALPGRGEEARAAIDEAVAYARDVNARAVHVMAGFAEGPEADAAFRAALSHACAAAPDLTVLIEPLNRHDAPGYYLTTTDQARGVIEAVGASNLKLMFDCYHVQATEGDVTRRLRACADILGHVQFASVPDRGPPDGGELSYAHMFDVVRDLGWDTPLGAEYKPGSMGTDATLGWLRTMRG